MTVHRGSAAYLHWFITWDSMEAERLTWRTDRFTPGKEARCPLYRRLGGPQGRSERFGLQNSSLRATDPRHFGRQATSLVTTLTELHRLVPYVLSKEFNFYSWFFCTLKCPDCLRGPPKLLSNGCRNLFPPRGVTRPEREVVHHQSTQRQIQEDLAPLW